MNEGYQGTIRCEWVGRFFVVGVLLLMQRELVLPRHRLDTVIMERPCANMSDPV